MARLARMLGLHRLRRRDEVDDRATILALLARFVDELASGLLIVLMPTLRRRLALSVTQVGMSFQVLYSAGAIVDPIAGAALDITRRRPWLIVGAAGWGVALCLIAGAPSFGWLIAACGVAGVTSGPLVNAADVVLIESHPDDVERIQGRATMLDTIGAFLAPVTVVAASTLNVSHHVMLASVGVAVLMYAAVFMTATIPAADHVASSIADALVRVRAKVGSTVRSPRGRLWLVALMAYELLDLPELFEPIWLREVVGTSQGVVAAHVAVGYLASLVGLHAMDRLLERARAERVLIAACLATIVLYPSWLLVPGIVAKFLLVIPRNVATAAFWPILRARALAAVPGAAGTMSSLTSLVGIVPVAAGFGWLAQRVGLTTTMLSTVLLGTAGVYLMVAASRRLS